MGKRIICGCVVLGIVACLIGCQKSDNYELMKHCRYGEDNEGYIMKYTIAKMFQILRHNRWVSILMIIEIALGMSVFTYSLNMFFSLSREKEVSA